MQSEAFLPPTPDYRLKKSERLCSKKAFELLFSKGKTAFSHPVKLVYAIEKTDATPTVQVAFGTSKRNFKRAVKRNRVKRLLREAYRIQKIPLIEGLNQYYMFMYIGKEIASIEIIQAAISKTLNQVLPKNEKNT